MATEPLGPRLFLPGQLPYGSSLNTFVPQDLSAVLPKHSK